MRRATGGGYPQHQHEQNFYPRSPCGERPPKLSRVVPTPIFLSTLSLRRATYRRLAQQDGKLISIHALLAESDYPGREEQRRSLDFYPRSPCGERHLAAENDDQLPDISIHALLAESDDFDQVAARRESLFLSTLSLRRATPCPGFTFFKSEISIHALLAESDGNIG